MAYVARCIKRAKQQHLKKTPYSHQHYADNDNNLGQYRAKIERMNQYGHYRESSIASADSRVGTSMPSFLVISIGAYDNDDDDDNNDAAHHKHEGKRRDLEMVSTENEANRHHHHRQMTENGHNHEIDEGTTTILA